MRHKLIPLDSTIFQLATVLGENFCPVDRKAIGQGFLFVRAMLGRPKYSSGT
jgi:hypothetical protein